MNDPMRDVFSFRAAPALVDEYLSSVQVDEANPAFLFDWQLDNLTAFVAAANSLDAARAPAWLRTRPPHITPWSFVDDVVARFWQPQPLTGGRFGNIVLAPNTQSQLAGVVCVLNSLQHSAFLQNAAQVAFPQATNPERFLAVTYNTIDPSGQNYEANTLSPPFCDDRLLRQLFR